MLFNQVLPRRSLFQQLLSVYLSLQEVCLALHSNL